MGLPLWVAALCFFGLCRSNVPDTIEKRDANAPSSSWASSVQKARQLVDHMTLEEMNKMLYTYSAKTTGCTLTHGIDRLGFPGYCLNDGPAGVRAVDFTNAYPAGLSVAAGWNMELAYDRGLYMGKEFKAKGTQVAFAPVVGPLGRIAEGGRNWEGFGADPYLAGKMGAETVKGMQQSVIATIKHFIGNEQELHRSPTGVPTAYSSNIDDKTLHEIYMWPFQDAIQADVACVMCSYNRLNSTYACENPTVMKHLLKSELGFPGFIISDSFAQHAGIKSAAAGLDMALSTASFWDHDQLVRAVQKGKLPRARLEDMATRILASWFKVIGGPNNASYPDPGFGYPVSLLEPHPIVDARIPASKATMLQSAIEGHVLLKNTNNALPLRNPALLSLYGYDAPAQRVNYPSSAFQGNGRWNFGVESYNLSTKDYELDIVGYEVKKRPQSAVLGTVITGGGSGAGTPSFISDPYSAISQQAQNDDTYLLWNFESLNPAVNPASTACLVFINDFAAEGIDRNGLADPNSDILVKNVASKCKNTIVVIHNQGIRVVDAWIKNPNVTALIFAHTPGQVSGQALVDVLYGNVSPSGRLPYTVPKSAQDFGPILEPCTEKECNFSEREHIDYRRFLAKAIKPRFPFGHGLTYSRFQYSDISAHFVSQNMPTNPPNPNDIGPGGVKSLFDSAATVLATVANVGSVAAAEVAQLYVQFPGEVRMRQLRGFVKKQILPGKSAQVEFSLTRRDLSRWDVKSQQWQLQSGQYIFHVGPDVENVVLAARLSR